MSTNFKYNLTKSLRSYTKYIPQLTKPVLRVLIQGMVIFFLAQQPLESQLTRLCIFAFHSISALYRESKLFARSPGLGPDQTLANRIRDTRKFLWAIRCHTADHATIFAHTKGHGQRGWTARMPEGIAFHRRMHRRHNQSAAQSSRFIDPQLLRGEKLANTTKTLPLVHQFVVDWKVWNFTSFLLYIYTNMFIYVFLFAVVYHAYLSP